MDDEEPVRTEGCSIYFNPSRMEEKKLYPAKLHGRLYLIEKTEENVIYTYELRQTLMVVVLVKRLIAWIKGLKIKS